jgi:hypothetical protein
MTLRLISGEGSSRCGIRNRAPGNRQQRSPSQVARVAQPCTLRADLRQGGSMVPAAVGHGLEVRSPSAQPPQPCQLPGRFLPSADGTEAETVGRTARIAPGPRAQRPAGLVQPPSPARRLTAPPIERHDKCRHKAPRMRCTEVIVDGFRPPGHLGEARSPPLAHASASRFLGFGAHFRYPVAASEEVSHGLVLHRTAQERSFWVPSALSHLGSR